MKRETGREKALALLLSGKKITSHKACKVLGWKFATRISEAIRELEGMGVEVNKGKYKKRFRTYQLK